MTDYNPEEMNEAAQEAAENLSDLTGEITEIEQGSAHDFFGENTQGDPNKQMLEVTAELPGENEVTDYFALPDGEEPNRSWANPQFRLGRFHNKYGAVPEVGQEVEITVNEKGFQTIAITPVGEMVEGDNH